MLSRSYVVMNRQQLNQASVVLIFCDKYTNFYFLKIEMIIELSNWTISISKYTGWQKSYKMFTFIADYLPKISLLFVNTKYP